MRTLRCAFWITAILSKLKKRNEKEKLWFSDIAPLKLNVNRRWISRRLARAHTVNRSCWAAFVFPLSRKRTISSLRSVSQHPSLSLVKRAVRRFRPTAINKCEEFRRVYAQRFSRGIACRDFRRRSFRFIVAPSQSCARVNLDRLWLEPRWKEARFMLFSYYSSVSKLTRGSFPLKHLSTRFPSAASQAFRDRFSIN